MHIFKAMNAVRYHLSRSRDCEALNLGQVQGVLCAARLCTQSLPACMLVVAVFAGVLVVVPFFAGCL